MTIRTERNEDFNKKSWITDLALDAKFSKDLTSIYAEDIIQSIQDKEFSSLDDAIAALKIEVGLTTADVNDIKKVVIAKTEPDVHIAKQNILKLSKKDLGQLITLAATPCEKCENTPCDCAHSISSVASRAVNSIGLEVLAEKFDAMRDEGEVCKLENDASIELTKEASSLKELMSQGASATEAMDKIAKGMNPGFRAYLDKKKKEKEGKGEDKKDEGETSKKEDEKEAEANFKSKVERWSEFLGKKGYFQGQEEASVEGTVTSNDPEKLGYGSKDGVHYDKNSLETAKGPVRNEEQTAFEGAADKTKKNFGPSGEELKTKELWQRAKYMAAVKRIKEGNKK